jgi:hypothetical protein
LHGTGLVSQTRIIELYVSQKGTWTVLVSRPDGMSCLVAAGTDWADGSARQEAGTPVDGV